MRTTQATALGTATATAATSAVEPFAADPATVSPLLASMARNWHDALSAGERETLLRPMLPKLAGTRGSAVVEERRGVMAADWLVRCYLPNWLHAAGLVGHAEMLARAPEFTSMPALLLLGPALDRVSQDAHLAWIAARAEVKAVVPPDGWRDLLEDVRNGVREVAHANAEAAVRTPIEDIEWSKIEALIWGAVEASIWAVAWRHPSMAQAGDTRASIAAALSPLSTALAGTAMQLFDRMASFEWPASRQAFFDLADFPQLAELAAAWQMVRDEAATLQAPVMNVDRTGQTYSDTLHAVVSQVEAGEPFGWVSGGNPGAGRDWTQLGIIMHGQHLPFAAPVLPRTQALFRGLPGIKVAALFRLAPNTVLPTHAHPHLSEGDLLQMHVTITAPAMRSRAYLNVRGEFREHLPGAAFIFDGSLDHFAVNASEEERVILYVEFERVAMCRPRAPVAMAA